MLEWFRGMSVFPPDMERHTDQSHGYCVSMPVILSRNRAPQLRWPLVAAVFTEKQLCAVFWEGTLWCLPTISSGLHSLCFCLFFPFSFADYIVYSCSVINIYNFNNFWVPESHSPWSRNAQRYRYHLNTRSGCITQADSKLILLPLISLMLKLQVGATMQRAVSKEWPLLYCLFNFR